MVARCAGWRIHQVTPWRGRGQDRSVKHSRLWGIVTSGQLGDSVEIAGQLQIFWETVLRPAKNRLETMLSVLLEEVRPGVRVRFYEMDITDAKADAQFFDKMIARGVYKPEEAREILDRLRA